MSNNNKPRIIYTFDNHLVNRNVKKFISTGRGRFAGLIAGFDPNTNGTFYGDNLFPGDSILSIEVPEGYKVKAWEGQDRMGQSIEIIGKVPDMRSIWKMGDTTWDKEISCLEVSKLNYKKDAPIKAGVYRITNIYKQIYLRYDSSVTNELIYSRFPNKREIKESNESLNFLLIPDRDNKGEYLMFSIAGNKCVDVIEREKESIEENKNKNNTENIPSLNIFDPDNRNKFKFSAIGNGYYQISNGKKYLATKPASLHTDIGHPMFLENPDNENTINLQWKLEKVSDIDIPQKDKLVDLNDEVNKIPSRSKIKFPNSLNQGQVIKLTEKPLSVTVPFYMVHDPDPKHTIKTISDKINEGENIEFVMELEKEIRMDSMVRINDTKSISEYNPETSTQKNNQVGGNRSITGGASVQSDVGIQGAGASVSVAIKVWGEISKQRNWARGITKTESVGEKYKLNPGEELWKFQKQTKITTKEINKSKNTTRVVSTEYILEGVGYRTVKM